MKTCRQTLENKQIWIYGLSIMLGGLPVPLMALVLMTVMVSQIGKAYSDFEIIAGVIPIYVLFLLITPIVSQIIARAESTLFH